MTNQTEPKAALPMVPPAEPDGVELELPNEPGVWLKPHRDGNFWLLEAISDKVHGGHRILKDGSTDDWHPMDDLPRGGWRKAGEHTDAEILQAGREGIRLGRLTKRAEAAELRLRQSHHLCCNYRERQVGECNCVAVMKGDVKSAEAAEKQLAEVRAERDGLRAEVNGLRVSGSGHNPFDHTEKIVDLSKALATAQAEVAKLREILNEKPSRTERPADGVELPNEPGVWTRGTHEIVVKLYADELLWVGWAGSYRDKGHIDHLPRGGWRKAGGDDEAAILKAGREGIRLGRLTKRAEAAEASVQTLTRERDELEKAVLEEIGNRDSAQDRLDVLTATLLQEDIDWSCHESKWSEAQKLAESLIAERDELRRELDTAEVKLRHATDWAEKYRDELDDAQITISKQADSLGEIRLEQEHFLLDANEALFGIETWREVGSGKGGVPLTIGQRIKIVRDQLTAAQAEIAKLRKLLTELRQCIDPNWYVWKQQIEAALAQQQEQANPQTPPGGKDE